LIAPAAAIRCWRHGRKQINKRLGQIAARRDPHRHQAQILNPL
jgi:hypothetical protein